MAEQAAVMPKKSADGTPPETHQSVRLPIDVVRMARSISSVTDTPMSDVIADIARPHLRQAVEKLIKAGAFLPEPPD